MYRCIVVSVVSPAPSHTRAHARACARAYRFRRNNGYNDTTLDHVVDPASNSIFSRCIAHRYGGRSDRYKATETNCFAHRAGASGRPKSLLHPLTAGVTPTVLHLEGVDAARGRAEALA